MFITAVTEMAALTAFGVLQHSPLIFGQNWVYSNQDSGFCLMLQQEIYHSPSQVPRPSCEFGNLTWTHLTWHRGRGEIVNGAADSCYFLPSAASKWNVCTQYTCATKTLSQTLPQSFGLFSEIFYIQSIKISSVMIYSFCKGTTKKASTVLS